MLFNKLIRKFSSFSLKGTQFNARSLYLDMQATTPIDPRVLDKMLPYYLEQFGNAHSRTHMYGWEGEQAIEEAREHVANVINADSKEIVLESAENTPVCCFYHIFGERIDTEKLIVE